MRLRAIANEPKESNYGQVIAQNITPMNRYEGMNKEEFIEAVKLTNWVSFRVEEV